MGIYRKYISEDADMQTMLFRYAVLVDLFGARLPDELKCKSRLPDELKNKILRKPYSEQIDRLIFLYGTGIIDEETLRKLVLHNDSDFLSDVIELENEVRKSEDADEADILPYEQLQKIISVCANSKKYDALSDISFEDVIKISSSSHAFITESGFVRCDKALTDFLNSLGEPFGFYDSDDDEIKIETSQYVSEAVSGDYDIHSDKLPIAADCAHLKYFLDVYDELYGRDFIAYAAENNIPFNENYSNEYQKYLSGIKLCFDFKGYPKKREICGEKINYYDYAVNSVEENNSVKSELTPDSDYAASIRLDVDEPLQDNELTEKALRKYKSTHQLLENMTIEVIHGGKSEFYIHKSGNIIPVNVSEFRRQLFDFNKIWSIIQLCSREKKIKRVGDVITLPQEYINEISPDQREYAINMVKEQYNLLLKKRHNKHLQTLNELRAAAAKLNKPTNENVGTRKQNSDPKNENGGK